MPYRRLPNTNQARLRSLQQASAIGEYVDIYELAFSYKHWEEAKVLVKRYETALYESKRCTESQISNSKKQQIFVKNARLYISHFIQVLNMCVQRNEIKSEMKDLYGLDLESYAVPDLSSDEALVEWGKKIISGEQTRLQRGGTPIYNPAIAKVKVHYDIFLEGYNNQKILQGNTNRSIDNINELNKAVDALILQIWNEVEDKFKNLPTAERLEACKKYGLIYYYRKGEKVISDTEEE